MRIIFLFCLSFLTTLTLLAQEESSVNVRKSKKHADTNYVKSYKNLLSLGMYIAAPSNTLTITPKDSLKPPTKYKTNLSSVIGFTMAYKSISGSIGFRLPIKPNLTNEYGTTAFKSFSIGTQQTKFSLQFDFRKVGGFYNSDSLITTSATSTTQASSTYFKRGDVTSKQYMVSGLYNFSWKKYSYQSSFNFSEHQLKTRIGFIMKSSLSFNRLNSDSSLITMDKSASNSEQVQQLNYTSFLLGPGMGLNVVIAKRVYFSLMVFYSYDYVTYTFIDNNNFTKNRSNSFTAFYEGRVALGYHSKRFYAGLKVIADQIAVQTTDYRVGNSFGVLTLDVGYRFHAPGIIKKVYKKTFTRYLGL